MVRIDREALRPRPGRRRRGPRGPQDDGLPSTWVQPGFAVRARRVLAPDGIEGNAALPNCYLWDVSNVHACGSPNLKLVIGVSASRLLGFISRMNGCKPVDKPHSSDDSGRSPWFAPPPQGAIAFSLPVLLRPFICSTCAQNEARRGP